MAVEDISPQELSLQIPSEHRVRKDPIPHEVGPGILRQQRVRTGAPTHDMPTQGEVPAELPTDVDCLIVSKLLSLIDRCALQGVSRRWRSATRQCVRPPLPLILNAELTISNCFTEGLQCVPLRMSSNVPHPPGHEVTCLGALNSWVVLAYDEWNPHENLALPHKSCLLVQPVKGGSLSLPSPCSFETESLSSSLQITGANGMFSYRQPIKTCSLRLKKVVLSHSSSPGDSKVLGLATQRGAQHIVFSTPVMTSWYVCSSDFITAGSDIEILEDKIIVLGTNQQELYQIDFGPAMSFFPVVCEVRRCMVMELPELANAQQQLNLVRSANNLLLVARYFNLTWEQLIAVRVFQLDTSSWTWLPVQSLGERSILVSLSSSQTIDVYGQGDPKADRIYFLDQFCPNFFPAEDAHFSYRAQVYSMKDGVTSELLIGTGRGTHRPGFPMWYFPSE